MDLIVDIIIYLIKQFARTREPQIRPPTPQELAAHQAAMKQRLEAMQKVLAVQQARVQPKRRPPATARQAAPARVSLPQPAANRTTPMPSQPTVSPTEPPRKRTPVAAGLKVPLIFGEILAPPLALREIEQC